MNLIDILTTGGIGSAIGAVAGLGEKWVLGKQEAAAKAAERAHILEMQRLQMQHESNQAEQELRKAEIVSSGEVWVESFKHDAGIGQTSVWVNNTRAMVRPAALLGCYIGVMINPIVFAGYFGTALGWWYASRGRAAQPR